MADGSHPCEGHVIHQDVLTIRSHSRNKKGTDLLNDPSPRNSLPLHKGKGETFTPEGISSRLQPSLKTSGWLELHGL